MTTTLEQTAELVEGLNEASKFGGTRKLFLDSAEALSALRAKVTELELEIADCDKLRERMGNLLTGTANALKGEPDKLHLHDWSDLPQVAATLKANWDAAQGQEPVGTIHEDGYWNRANNAAGKAVSEAMHSGKLNRLTVYASPVPTQHVPRGIAQPPDSIDRAMTQEAAEKLLAVADAAELIVTIDRVPRLDDLRMGNADYRVELRPKYYREAVAP